MRDYQEGFKAVMRTTLPDAWEHLIIGRYLGGIVTKLRVEIVVTGLKSITSVFVMLVEIYERHRVMKKFAKNHSNTSKEAPHEPKFRVQK